MEDLVTKDEGNGMLVGEETTVAVVVSSLQQQLQHSAQQLHQQQSPLLQHPLRLTGAESQYLEGLLREKESLGTSPGMDLARRLVTQGEF